MARTLVTLRTAATLASMAAIALSGVAADDVAHVCLQYGATYYDLKTDASGTTMDRYNTAVSPAALIDHNTFAALHRTANNGDYWSEGVDFVATMQTRHAWINQDPNAPAYWDHDAVTGADAWRFETNINGSPVELAFRSSQCTGGAAPTTLAPPPPTTSSASSSCPAAAGGPGVTCAAGEDCCGYGKMNPHCIPKGTGDHCCTWYLSSVTCNSTQTCCGELGPGASSYAFCCNEGSTCCTASVGYDGTSSCCPSGSTCCQGSTVGLCCASDEECVPNMNSCRKIGGAGETTTTNAPGIPSSPPTTMAASDSHRVCGTFGSMIYDITTNPSGTTMLRYNTAANPPTFVDSNSFSALHMTANNGDYWHEGVDFVAAMQTRHAWVNQDPNAPAYWDHDAVTGADTWRFETNINGPVTLTLSSSNCPAGSQPTSSPPPPTTNTAHVCLQYGSSYYDLTTDPSAGTVMKRYNTAVNPPALIDTNTFAALHQTANSGDYWHEGVDFVAAMQTRLAWINQDPNAPAYWDHDMNTGADTWRFETTINGSPAELAFRSSQCTLQL